MNTLLGSPARMASATQSARPGPGSILYAEDNDALRRLSTLTLTRSGYDVTPVQDGLQAWEALHTGHYDLLIADNEMPRMTGLELATKARHEGIELPIIMASGSLGCLTGSDHECLRVSASLSKPFSSDTLLDAVKEALCAISSSRRDAEFRSEPAEAAWETRPTRHWGLNE